MSFTYEPGRADFPNSVELVRMYLTDTNPDNYCFEDEEIQAQLSLTGSVKRAAARLWNIVAGNVRYLGILFVVRTWESIDVERASSIARELAAKLEAEANREEGVGLPETEARWTWDWEEELERRLKW